MSIAISHRFIDRILPGKSQTSIRYLIIGTFNPGLPDEPLLTESESRKFKIIAASDKFKKFNATKNFYDRSQNRFWGIMDRLNQPELYEEFGQDYRNPNGLKYYKHCNRVAVFQRQQEFCQKQGIFITDLVRTIYPSSFHQIYDNFPDTMIEAANPDWNTTGLLKAIKKYKPKKVLVNFRKNNALPGISNQVERIESRYPGKVFFLPSSSGSAKKSYSQLMDYWSKLIKVK